MGNPNGKNPRSANLLDLSIRWTLHHVIGTSRVNIQYTRVLIYSDSATIAGWEGPSDLSDSLEGRGEGMSVRGRHALPHQRMLHLSEAVQGS